MGFPRQEYWSGLPFPSPGDLPDLGIKPTFPALAGKFFTAELPGKLSERRQQIKKKIANTHFNEPITVYESGTWEYLKD